MSFRDNAEKHQGLRKFELRPKQCNLCLGVTEGVDYQYN